MKPIYAKLHEGRGDHLELARRARAYQAQLAEIERKADMLAALLAATGSALVALFCVLVIYLTV